jgi:hypothetical protein
MLNILSTIGQALGLIDKFSMSGEDRAELVKTETAQEGKVAEARSKTVAAEAQGQSWLQRNWRPITMIVFLILIVLDSFGKLPHRLPQQAWDLMGLGFIGYISGRSVEKIFKKM